MTEDTGRVTAKLLSRCKRCSALARSDPNHKTKVNWCASPQACSIASHHISRAALILVANLPNSSIELAMMYEEGRGVDKDPHRARELYRQAGFEDIEPGSR